jgi:hypothetical protein
MMQSQSLLLLVVAAVVVATANAFLPVPVGQKNAHGVAVVVETPTATSTSTSLYGIFDKVGDKMGEFFEDLDAFVDDATSRRLGAGAAFYGKRKSKFYGEKDIGIKSDPTVADPTEDYQGPTSTGLFMWMQDEEGQMRPVTRGKMKVIERNPNFWDKFYDKEESKKKKDQSPSDKK